MGPLPLLVALLMGLAHPNSAQPLPDVVSSRQRFFPGTNLPIPEEEPVRPNTPREELQQRISPQDGFQPPPVGDLPPAPPGASGKQYIPVHDTDPGQPEHGFLIAMDSKGRRVKIDKSQKITMPLDYILDHRRASSRSKAYATLPEMCDSCKTMVEELHRALHKLTLVMAQVNRDGPLYHKNFSATALKAVNNLCNGSKFQHFAPHIRSGCEYMLHGERRDEVLRVFDTVHPIHIEHGTHAEGKGYVPKHCVWRRRMICEDIFGVCPEVPPPMNLAHPCRTCAEVFRDLHFVNRRDHPRSHTSAPAFRDETAGRRKRLYSQLMDLCEDVHLRHSYGHAVHLKQRCIELVDQNLARIMDAYMQPPEEDPARFICVNVTNSCSRKSFAQHSAHCEHEHDFHRRAALHERHAAKGEGF